MTEPTQIEYSVRESDLGHFEITRLAGGILKRSIAGSFPALYPEPR